MSAGTALSAVQRGARSERALKLLPYGASADLAENLTSWNPAHES